MCPSFTMNAAKAGRTLEDFKPDFKADLHPRTIGGGWPDSRLVASDFLSKNPLLCGVITIIYLLPIETERRRTQTNA